MLIGNCFPADTDAQSTSESSGAENGTLDLLRRNNNGFAGGEISSRQWILYVIGNNGDGFQMDWGYLELKTLGQLPVRYYH